MSSPEQHQPDDSSIQPERSPPTPQLEGSNNQDSIQPQRSPPLPKLTGTTAEMLSLKAKKQGIGSTVIALVGFRTWRELLRSKRGLLDLMYANTAADLGLDLPAGMPFAEVRQRVWAALPESLRADWSLDRFEAARIRFFRLQGFYVVFWSSLVPIAVSVVLCRSSWPMRIEPGLATELIWYAAHFAGVYLVSLVVCFVVLGFTVTAYLKIMSRLTGIAVIEQQAPRSANPPSATQVGGLRHRKSLFGSLLWLVAIVVVVAAFLVPYGRKTQATFEVEAGEPRSLHLKIDKGTRLTLHVKVVQGDNIRVRIARAVINEGKLIFDSDLPQGDNVREFDLDEPWPHDEGEAILIFYSTGKSLVSAETSITR